MCFSQEGQVLFFCSCKTKKIRDCRRKKFMWTYYSCRQRSESHVLMQSGDKKVSNPAQHSIDSVLYSSVFLPPVMVI